MESGVAVLGLAMMGGLAACNPVAVVTYRQFGRKMHEPKHVDFSTSGA